MLISRLLCASRSRDALTWASNESRSPLLGVAPLSFGVRTVAPPAPPWLAASIQPEGVPGQVPRGKPILQILGGSPTPKGLLLLIIVEVDDLAGGRGL
jgi:hypothetical protein